MGQGQTAGHLTGINGGEEITDLVAHPGDFMAIQAVGNAPATVGAATVCNIANWGDTVLSPGQTIYGQFTSVILTDGSVIAYTR